MVIPQAWWTIAGLSTIVLEPRFLLLTEWPKGRFDACILYSTCRHLEGAGAADRLSLARTEAFHARRVSPFASFAASAAGVRHFECANLVIVGSRS